MKIYIVVIAFAATLLLSNNSYGQRVPSSPAELLSLIRKAEQGDADSQFILGWLHDHGTGRVKDNELIPNSILEYVNEGFSSEELISKADNWYRKSAEQGHEEAINWLEHLYPEYTEADVAYCDTLVTKARLLTMALLFNSQNWNSEEEGRREMDKEMRGLTYDNFLEQATMFAGFRFLEEVLYGDRSRSSDDVKTYFEELESSCLKEIELKEVPALPLEQ